MILTEMIAALRVELNDVTAQLWTDDDLGRAIVKATEDVSRIFPLEKFYEITFKPDVKDEAWTAGSSAGVWKQLANKPISWESEAVKNSAGAACVRDIDYYIDYINGRITHIAGGKISDNEACTISYTKSKIALDVSALNIIRIHKIEYPYGKIPQLFASYDYFGDILWLTGIEADTQSKLIEGKHIVIYYYTAHTPPTTADRGSFPRHLDEVVIKGASSYACDIRALFCVHKARELLAAISHGGISTALTNAIAQLAKAAAALDKVSTHLTGTIPSAAAYLAAGDDFINKVNIGDRVPDIYSEYAARSGDIAARFINEAEQRNTASRWYIQEATERNAEISSYLAEADRYLALADRWRAEATERRNEFLTVLHNRAELRGRAITTSSVRQIK